MIPAPWEFALLALAAFRVCRLLAIDEVLEPIRCRLPAPVLHFLGCPWCLGFWLSVGAYTLWRLEPKATLILAAIFALSAAVGLIAQNLDAD